jgi:hypothetical protein
VYRVWACFLPFAQLMQGTQSYECAKSPSIDDRSLGSERSVEVKEDHSLALLCFTTANGLLSFVAAMFTTMLPLSAGWRYFWLVICLVTFGLSVVGMVLFCLSYKGNKPRDVY